MDKEFGVELKNKFDMPGFPVYLVHLMLEECINPATQEVLIGYSQKIPEKYPAFLTKAWSTQGLPDFYEFAQYLDDTTGYFSEAYWAALSRYCLLSEKYFRTLTRDCVKYRQLYGKDNVNKIILNYYRHEFEACGESGNETELSDLLNQLSSYGFTSTDKMILEKQIEFYDESRNWKKMMIILTEYVHLYGENAFVSNEYCWDVYEYCNDDTIVNQACEIIANALDNYPRYVELDTYASLLYKSKNYNKAFQIVTQAIAVGKEEGMNTSHCDDLLHQVETAIGK